MSLPDAEDIREGIEATEAEQAARERWLAGPEAIKQRQQSRHAFAELSAADSKGLFLDLFSEHLRRLNTDPARWLSDASIVEPLDESSATVRKEGDTTLLSGTVPLRAEDEDGELRKVDLTLEATSEGLEPANPLVELRIPEVAGEGIAMGEGERSIAVTPLGVEDRPVQLLGDKNAFYPDALGASADTDQILAPTSTGVEIFELLRSADSPEAFRYRIEMPEGAELVPDETGGARIVRDREQIASIPFPYAIDAQGTPHEVELEIEGDTVVLSLPHREANVAYPLLLDPAIVNDYYNYNWFNGHNINFLENGTWNYSENWGWIEGFTSCQYSCFGPSGRALYISMIGGAHGGDEWGQWLFKSPNANSFLAGAWANPFVRDDRTCNHSQYPQPHDYLGMWHNGTWNGAVKINQAITYGYTEANSWGSALVIGMGTGNGSATPCRRDLAVGGAAIWEDDWQQPSIDGVSGIPSGWIGDESVPITVQARDEGLGVDYVSLHPFGGGGTQVKNHSCNGYAGSRCPINWPVLFDLHADHFAEGVREVWISATDPTFKTSLTYEAQTKGRPQSTPGHARRAARRSHRRRRRRAERQRRSREAPPPRLQPQSRRHRRQPQRRPGGQALGRQGHPRLPRRRRAGSDLVSAGMLGPQLQLPDGSDVPARAEQTDQRRRTQTESHRRRPGWQRARTPPPFSVPTSPMRSASGAKMTASSRFLQTLPSAPRGTFGSWTPKPIACSTSAAGGITWASSAQKARATASFAGRPRSRSTKTAISGSSTPTTIECRSSAQ